MGNLNESKKYHFIYKTTNLLNGKYYIGMHTTTNLNDGYLGSGKYLRRSILKHGKENFKCEILQFCDSKEELSRREREMVTIQEVVKTECMNLKAGGFGGFAVEDTKKGRQKCDEILRNKYGEDFRSIINKNYNNSLSNEEKELRIEKIKEGQKKSGFLFTTFLGKKHNPETIVKMRESRGRHSVGSTHPLYGKHRSNETKQKIRESLAKTRGLNPSHYEITSQKRELERRLNTFQEKRITKKTIQFIFKTFHINIENRCEEGMEELKTILKEHYIKKEFSTLEISKIYKTSSEVIRRYLDYFSIKRRKLGR